MKLWAISDLHLDFRINREALREIPPHTEDWLITGGDLCTSERHLRETLDALCPKFARVFWVPGNHELWSSRPMGEDAEPLHGEQKYQHLVSICREHGVLTPEDPFEFWPEGEARIVVAPLFIPYDYSFRPDHVELEDAVSWAMESGVLCSDEKLIDPRPHASMIEWCRSRYQYSLQRLDALPRDASLVLINHFPLRQDLVRIRRIPRFSIWCGTKLTEDLHLRYPVKVAVSGHLHVRATDYRGGVRFEEVSLGYPRDWDQSKGMAYYMREILPGPIDEPAGDHGPVWRYY